MKWLSRVGGGAAGQGACGARGSTRLLCQRPPTRHCGNPENPKLETLNTEPRSPKLETRNPLATAVTYWAAHRGKCREGERLKEKLEPLLTLGNSGYFT